MATDGGSHDLVEEQHGAARWLRLNRPERRNALTIDLVRRLANALGAAGADPAVRAVVLTGSPPVFCAGGDLEDLGAVAERGALAVAEVIYREFHRLVRTLAETPVPVIAAVNGPALGAGLDLAMACDLRVASTAAVFTSSWIKVGLVPGMGGAHLLARAVGATRANEMVLLGRPVSSERALDWGLVNDLAEPDELESRVEDLVGEISALPAMALDRSKASLRRALALGFEQELAVLGSTQGALLAGEDFRAAAARFRR